MKMRNVDGDISGRDQIQPSNIPDEMEVLRTFAAVPEFTLELLSLYYPLPIAWMKKYADVLYWGSSAATDVGTYWGAGIVFNHAIAWTGGVRALVASQLAVRGGDFEFSASDLDWETYQKDQPTEFSRLVVDYSLLNRTGRLLDFVALCPRTINTFINADASAQCAYDQEYCEPPDIPSQDELDAMSSEERTEFGEQMDAYHQFMYSDEIPSGYIDSARSEWEPSITTHLVWREVQDLLQKQEAPRLIANPSLWDLTLKELFTEAVVKQLLDYFYCEHLGVNCETVSALKTSKVEVEPVEIKARIDGSRSEKTSLKNTRPTETHPNPCDDDLPF